MGGKRKLRRLGVAACGVLLIAGAAAAPAGAATTVFSNPSPITIPDNFVAGPYPSTIAVSGLQPGLTDLTVTLAGLSHGFADDIDIAVVSADGRAMMLMSDVGGPYPIAGPVDLTFSDDASSQIPDSSPGPAASVASGGSQPTNHASTLEPDAFPGVGPGTAYANPGPSGAGSATLRGSFGGADPNGSWNLFVIDDAAGQAGTIAGGWSLTLTTPDLPDTTAPETTITKGPKNKTKKTLATFEFTAAEPGASFECSFDGEAFRPCASPEDEKVAGPRATSPVAAGEPPPAIGDP